MADNSAPEVDPRFDPVFQRGYDPAVHPAPVRRSVLRTPAVKPAPLPEPPAPVAEVIADAAPEDEPQDGRRNPWLLALVLVSVAFLLAAGGLVWAFSQRNIYSFSGTPGAPELMVQQLTYMLPPALLVAGVLGLVLRVALGAIRAGRG